MEKNYQPSDRLLPSILANSDEFQALNDTQRENFLSRIRYLEEIFIKIRQWVDLREGFESTLDFVDEIELDLLINLSTGESERMVSPWLIHSSWTFNTTPDSMRGCLPDCLTRQPLIQELRWHCEEIDFLQWVKGRSECASATLDGFFESESYECVIGHLIALDILLSQLLAVFSQQRFNSNLKAPRT